jgi:hypothetical protein
MAMATNPPPGPGRRGAVKHRYATYSVLPAPPNLPEPTPPLMGIFIAKRGTSMQQGTPWLRLNWSRREEPPRKVKVGTNRTLGIAFGDIGLDREAIPVIAKNVWKIIERFLVEFPETVFSED